MNAVQRFMVLVQGPRDARDQVPACSFPLQPVVFVGRRVSSFVAGGPALAPARGV